MKLLKTKPSQKEVEKLLLKQTNSVASIKSIQKWIGLIAYPFFVLCPFQKSFAQSLNFNRAYEQVLELNFDKNREALTKQHIAGFPYANIYLQNLNDVLELVFTENETRYSELKDNESERLDLLDDLTNDSPYIGFVRAEIKLQWAFAKLKFGHTWSGVWSLRRAFKTIEDNIQRHPEFKLNYKTMGLLHVIFGAVPDHQQWVLSILGLEGDVALGLKEIEEIKKADNLFNTELSLISALIESYLLENHNAALSRLDSDSGEEKSLAEAYITSLILMKSHEAKKSAVILKKALGQNQNNLFLFNYLLGEAQFQGGDYLNAQQNYSTFLNGFRGSGQKKDAMMKLAMCDLFLNNNLTRFNITWAEAAAMKNSEAEADKNAHKILSGKTLPNFDLLKIRFAIDGGFYTYADSLVIAIDLDKIKPYEFFELDYRKARLAHLQGDFDSALTYYYQVISNAERLPETYFVPNSYLQIGYLKLEQGDKPQARMYFNKVLEFKDHPYKNSLDSKAKIAIEAINASGG
uniref:tetratricopeptide repeat protein n=1 Tax=Roseivirga sp. TaxID=1964215 RepID=UPI0040483118